ncbi:uncharacterized protein EKO05_0005359 [Ascochyta rabiei]|uniref:uncharacterized protein n=1 Tax=Didymella rabiei TaxID=5454 RepID=UPI0021F93334|nr:uncharacterized protein EKO05_0005359 [Ascochyta rabiei]UPX14888.1 hypothetical protein EKO05_0005359 [Ascochyta rabiei]
MFCGHLCKGHSAKSTSSFRCFLLLVCFQSHTHQSLALFPDSLSLSPIDRPTTPFAAYQTVQLHAFIFLSLSWC